MPAWKNTTLQSSGSISLNEIHVEAGGTSGTQCTLNDQRIRNLIGVKKNSGTQQDFADCYGAYADGHPGVDNREGQPIAVWGDGTGGAHSFVGHSIDTSRRRSFVYGNTFSYSYMSGEFSGNSYTYTNNTSLIQYFARSSWTDEGEGDFDGAIIVVAVAPGGSATASASWSVSSSGGNTFSTSNSNLAKVVLTVNDISESYPQDGSGNGAMSGTGTMYPFGVTVD